MNQAVEVADDAERYYAPMREAFLERRIEEMLEDFSIVLSIFDELRDSSMEKIFAVSLRDMLKEQGICWDAGSSLVQMCRSCARARAAQEWDEMPRNYKADREDDKADFLREA